MIILPIDKERRKKELEKQLSYLKNEIVYCEGLNKNVGFNVSKIVSHSYKSYINSLAALRVKEATIKGKRNGKDDEAKEGTQSKLKFKNVSFLKSFLSGIGEVKIVVGNKTINSIVYSISRHRTRSNKDKSHKKKKATKK